MLVNEFDPFPALGEVVTRYMLETVSVRAVLTRADAATDLHVQVWTNLPTRFNSDGTWYAIPLPHVHSDSQGREHFAMGLKPTSSGSFGLTYRVCHGDRPHDWHWLGHPHNDVRLDIAPPAHDMDWTQGPNHVEVMPGIYVGNFIAASQAESLGFDAVLNMAEELDSSLPADGAIAYRKLSCRDGAHHPIPEPLIQAAIAWLTDQQAQGKQRILVHCRAGIGRSGSISIAYCFHHHPEWSYQQTLDYVWSKKPDIYPHRQLQTSLETLFPRP